MANSANHELTIRQLTVAELVIAVKESSPADASPYCEELVGRFEPLLRSMWRRRISNLVEYQDFVQEVFVRLFANLDQLQSPGAFPGYFRQIVLSAVVDWLRKAGRNQSATLDLEKALRVASEIDEDIVTQIFIRTYLERLAPRERAILLLEYFDGYKGPEIAEKLGLTPGNIRVIKHRALNQLKERMLADARTLNEGDSPKM